MYILFQLREGGFSAKKINQAREAISKRLQTPYPLATSKVFTDHKAIFYSSGKELLNADRTQQINLEEIVFPFLQKIDFDDKGVAERYWPLGKSASIVVDPHHQYGQPTIKDTNI